MKRILSMFVQILDALAAQVASICTPMLAVKAMLVFVGPNMLRMPTYSKPLLIARRSRSLYLGPLSLNAVWQARHKRVVSTLDFVDSVASNQLEPCPKDLT